MWYTRVIKVNNLVRRCDIVIYDRQGTPKLIVECKASDIKINQKTFDQIAKYNMGLGVDYLLVTNGQTHFCCKINYIKHTYDFLHEIPDYSEL